MMSSLSVRLAAFASVAVAEQTGFLAASSNATTVNQSATLENAVNMTQFDRLAANEEAYASCSDTPNWNNGWYDCSKETTDPAMCNGGWTCAAYVAKGWCRAGRCLGPDETGGVYACGDKLKSPERNCCACGGGESCKPLGSSCERSDECCPDGAGGFPTCADMGYGKECISP